VPDRFGLPPAPPAPRDSAAPQRRPEGPNTVFFALVLDVDQSRPILDLQARLHAEEGLTGKPIDAARLHVTLHDLGGHDEPSVAFVDAARRAGESVSMASFEIVFDRAQSFPRQRGKRPFVLIGSEESTALGALRTRPGDLGRRPLASRSAHAPHDPAVRRTNGQPEADRAGRVAGDRVCPRAELQGQGPPQAPRRMAAAQWGA
jgi:2'-5' RNA ligase